MAGSIAAIPAPERGWLLVSGESEMGNHVDLHDLVKKRSDVTIGLPASLVSTFPVLLPSTDASLHANMIFAQVEKRGLSGGPDGESLIDFELLNHDPEGDTFAVSVATHLPPDMIVVSASGYATSAMLRPVPSGGCRIWQEWGRLILGIYSDGHPVHVQVLSGGEEINEATAREVSLILLSLRGDPAMEDRMPKAIELSVAEVSEQELAAFSHVLDLPVSKSAVPHQVVPRLPNREKLLPSSVGRSRSKKKTNQRVAFFAVVALIVYLVAAAWLWLQARQTARDIESMENQIAIVEPDVERIQQVEQRWSRLEPAFEKKWFPVVQLSRIASALPASGVVVREYRTSGRNIRVSGQARDVQLVNRLLEDLQAMDYFSAYEWSMPNPKVEKNNTANFTISGEPKNAGADS